MTLKLSKKLRISINGHFLEWRGITGWVSQRLVPELVPLKVSLDSVGKG